MSGVDLALKTSTGLTPIDFALQKQAALASEPADGTARLSSDAIVDMLQHPENALLFRRAYDKEIDKMIAKDALRKQRLFGLFYIFLLSVYVR
jgi:hypothetical protein